MCHIRMVAPLSPDKASVLCHIPIIHAGVRGSGKVIIFHTGIKPQSGGLPSWLMHREKKELTNHNNNHHHPAVSTVASPHSISAITQFRSLLKMRQYCCWISCVSAYVCAEHANCSVLLVTSVSQPVMGHILVGLFTWLSSLKWSSGAWLYCLMQSRLCGVLIKTEQSGRLAVV